jgi:hypothetical protein
LQCSVSQCYYYWKDRESRVGAIEWRFILFICAVFFSAANITLAVKQIAYIISTFPRTSTECTAYDTGPTFYV